MALFTYEQRNYALKALGFRGSKMVLNFQRSWNLGPALVADGLYGPATDAALKKSDYNRKHGLPTASAHFSFEEFKCRCGGRYSSCQGNLILRQQLQRLELLRTRIGPIKPVSGYRCPGRNREVGGASDSQHTYGTATDISGPSIGTMRGYRIFTGIGYSRRTGRVLHVDSRAGSPSYPTVWTYP